MHRGHNSVSITDRSGWGEPLSDQIWIIPFQCLRRRPNAPPEQKTTLSKRDASRFERVVFASVYIASCLRAESRGDM